MTINPRHILVIKLGALGDFVLGFGPFAAIRAHHPDATITLLTTKPFTDLASKSPWFDRVIIDERPNWWDIPALLRLARKLQGFDFVYDLQTSDRSSHYRWLTPRANWSGIAWRCSHPHSNPNRNNMHTIDRQRDQLAMAGVPNVPAPNLDWLRDQPLPTPLPAKFALLVPGAAPHRPAKRWPAEAFGTLAAALVPRGYKPVIIGAGADKPLADTIRRICPDAIDLTGKTDLIGLGAVAGKAALAIGNDTGPMHMAAMMGAKSIVLFSAESNPDLTAPRGGKTGDVTIIREASLPDLRPERVIAALP